MFSFGETLWEFMSKYADNFWAAQEYAFEVFSVIMAWSITIGCALFVIIIIWTIGDMIADAIRKYFE